MVKGITAPRAQSANSIFNCSGRVSQIVRRIVTPRYTTPEESQQTDPNGLVMMNLIDGIAHPSPILVANDAITPI